MKLQEAIVFFEWILKESENKKEVKIAKNFISIFKNIKNTNISQEGIENLEDYLNKSLWTIPSGPKSRALKREFRLLETHLKDNLNLVLKDYYTWLSMALGMVFWVAIGTIVWYDFGMGNPTTGGLIIWMILGVVIWNILDRRAESENRVINIK